MSEENGTTVDLSGLENLNFAPAWAKKDEKISVGKVHAERPARTESKGDKPAKPFSERKPFKKPFKKPSVERAKPLDCEVKILPDTKALGTIIRKIQGDSHAYKLKDLANFFLDNPSSILLKVVPKEERFFQCKACGFASTKEAEVAEHIVAVHWADYYDSKEIDCEPPKGNFTCVAKCGLSGVLLGPPNIHEFNSVVKEMIRTKYPTMSEEQYRAHIEMVREPEAIEEWRKNAVRKTVFFPKGQAETEGIAPMTREQVEGEMKRTILPSLLNSPKHLMITADVAETLPMKPLVWAVRDAIQLEKRAPYSMFFALRGAFHHRKLNFFRANDARGPEFVTSVELKEFDAAHAIPELQAASKFLTEHPCLDKSEFPAEIADFEKHLNWLVSTGHAVAFTNGVFSMVEKFPKYGPQWKKRPAQSAAPVESKPEVEVEEQQEVKKEEGNEAAPQLAE